MKETITMSDSQPAEYSIMDLVLAYRAHRDSLKRYKQQHFKSGTKVQVDNTRHRGYGECLPPDASRPDRVEVLMESGARWMFEFDHVKLVVQ